ncbi:MAG: tRNA pseudouridine(38-40) synthase TruA [Chloroflexota bacterium]
MAVTTRMVLTLEYDGTRYHGMQLQADLPTVQGEMETALYRLTGERTRVMAASRTDSGVHAKGQVVSFRTGSYLAPPAFVNGLNYYLPPAIAVTAAHIVDESFNVRRGAVSREYNYYILNSPLRSPWYRGFTYRVAGEIDFEAMRQACRALVGRHDFASFATCLGDEIKSTVRTVYKAGIEREGELAVFNIVANSFLPHQVRNTVGALIRLGRGKMSISEFCSIIEAREPGLAGPTAPACGLCLMRVNYPTPLGGDR